MVHTVKIEVLTNLKGEPKWLQGVIIEQTDPISYQVSVGDSIWRRHLDHLCPGSIASTDISASEGVSNDECPFHESSLQCSTETVPNTPESSTSTDQECRFPERESVVLLRDCLRTLKLSIRGCSIFVS